MGINGSLCQNVDIIHLIRHFVESLYMYSKLWGCDMPHRLDLWNVWWQDHECFVWHLYLYRDSRENGDKAVEFLLSQKFHTMIEQVLAV